MGADLYLRSDCESSCMHLQLRHPLLCELLPGQPILFTLASALDISPLLGGFLAMFLILETVVTSFGLQTIAGLAEPDITFGAVEKDGPPDTTVGRACVFTMQDSRRGELFVV